MTAFDYAVLAVIGISLLLGVWRGFVSELLALVGWLLAFLAVKLWAPAGAGQLTGLIADPAQRVAAAMVGIFVTVLLVVAVVRFVIRRALHAVGLGLVDRLLGAGFGVLRGVAVVLIGVAAAGLTKLPNQPWWKNAALASPMETAVLAAKPWLPPELAKRIRFR